MKNKIPKRPLLVIKNEALPFKLLENTNLCP